MQTKKREIYSAFREMQTQKREIAFFKISETKNLRKPKKNGIEIIVTNLKLLHRLIINVLSV